MQTYNNRRFELGLPLFSGLDLGLIFEAQEKLKKQDLAGLSTFISALGSAGKTHTIRKLAAIWAASDLELEQAEVDEKFMAKLEAQAANRLFSETFKDAMDFHSALFGLLGVSPASSGNETEQQPVEKKRKKAIMVDSPSAD